MRRGLSWLILLLVFPLLGCEDLPVRRHWDLRLMQKMMSAEEVDVYFPSAASGLEKSVEVFCSELQRSQDLITLNYKYPFFKRRFEDQMEEGTRLISRTRFVRERLQAELEATVESLMDELEAAQGSISAPHLTVLIERIQRGLEERGSFLEPGSYERNLELLDDLARLSRELRWRRIRFEGALLTREESRLQSRSFRQKLQGLEPTEPYILVDTGRNRLMLRQGSEVLLDAVCSTGSGYRLTAGERDWVFNTPRGEFLIDRKIPDPTWWKPDWAFLEAGERIPRGTNARVERNALGEWALGFGDGYFIHGTLYTRLLGEPVTHGCIRLAGEDLSVLAEHVDVGTRILVF